MTARLGLLGASISTVGSRILAALRASRRPREDRSCQGFGMILMVRYTSIPGSTGVFYSEHGRQAGGEPGSCKISIGIAGEVSLSAEVIGCTGQSIAVRFLGLAECGHTGDNCFLG